MLHLRVFGDATRMAELTDKLAALPGAVHVTRADTGCGFGTAFVTADLDAAAVDAALRVVGRVGVPAEDVALLRLEAIRSGRRHTDRLVWADLLGQAGRYARPVARYLVFMAAAGIIAAYGVIHDTEILIVGAMALSPDLLPVTAMCVGLTVRRGDLVRHAAWTLLAGLAVACGAAAVLTATLDLVGELPAGFQVGESSMPVLTEVGNSTVVVALVAGVVAMLAIETRAASAVGVAISVTTIPASAFLGAAVGMREADHATGALAVLGANVSSLVVGGTLALSVQRALERRQAPA